MATTSEFSIGLANKLFLALAEAGWTPGEVNEVAQNTEVLRGVRNIVRGAAEIKQVKRFALGATADLPARPEPFTSSDYFRTGSGLYVGDGFESLVLPVAGKTESTPATRVAHFDLLQDCTDEQIRAELPNDHVFQDAGIFCSHLAGMIDRQPNGKEGILLTDGYANIFYVNVGDRVVAVDVYWDAGDREWNVLASGLDDYRWGAGRRVFSAAAAA